MNIVLFHDYIRVLIKSKGANISWTQFMNSAATLFMSLKMLIPHHFVEFHLFRGMPPTEASCKYTFWKGASEGSWIYVQNLEWAFLFRSSTTFIYQKKHFKLGMFDACAKFNISQEKVKLWRLLETRAYFN